MSISEWFVRRALSIAKQRPAPDRIPMTDVDRMNARNYVFALIKDVSTNGTVNREWLFRDADQASVAADRWNEGVHRYADRETLPYPQVAASKLTLTVYAGRHEFVEKSAICFVIKDTIRWYRLVGWFRDRARERFYRTNLSRTQRIDVLRLIVGISIQQREPVSHITIMSVSDGLYVFSHPGFTEQQERIRLVLASLLETQDIAEDGSRYRPLGRALATIEAFDTDVTRFQQTARWQRIGLWVGGFAAAATVVQGLASVGVVDAYTWPRVGCKIDHYLSEMSPSLAACDTIGKNSN